MLDKDEAPNGYIAVSAPGRRCSVGDTVCAFYTRALPGCSRTTHECVASMRDDEQEVIFVKRQARDTSHAAYHNTDSMEHKVVECLQQHGALTRLELARQLGKPINCVTSPVLRLLEAGVIHESERVRQPDTGKLAWKLEIK